MCEEILLKKAELSVLQVIKLHVNVRAEQNMLNGVGLFPASVENCDQKFFGKPMHYELLLSCLASIRLCCDDWVAVVYLLCA